MFHESQKSIIDIFQLDETLKIPMYQRGFSWGIDNFTELWDDIVDKMLTEGQLHFFGVIILTKDSIHEATSEIIDGQQRLTCFTILLRAMYDHLKDPRDKAVADMIYEDCIKNSSKKNRLILGEDDAKIFDRYIQRQRPDRETGGKRKAEISIVTAYEFFYNSIISESKKQLKDVPEFVNNLYGALRKKTTLLAVFVPSEADPYTIFETINSKRVDLTASDLLKNYLFAAANSSGDQNSLSQVREDWQSMSNYLSTTTKEPELSQYLRHYWISNYEQVREKSLYRVIKNRFSQSSSELLEFSSNIALESIAYASIIDPSQSTNTSLNVSKVSSINELRIKQSYPLLLACLSVGISQLNFDKIVNGIISISIRRGIAQMNPNELEGTYGSCAREIRKYGNSAVKNVLQNLQGNNVSNTLVTTAIQQNALNEYAKFILKAYELKLIGIKQAEESEISKGITLEHIMPQKPTDYSEYDMSPIEHKLYLNMLGNLTLIGRSFNRNMSNSSYEDKKEALSGSSITSTNMIAKSYATWNKETIIDRSKTIGEFVIENWPDTVQ